MILSTAFTLTYAVALPVQALGIALMQRRVSLVLDSDSHRQDPPIVGNSNILLKAVIAEADHARKVFLILGRPVNRQHGALEPVRQKGRHGGALEMHSLPRKSGGCTE